MLGLTDPWIILGYILCIISTIVCVIYGLARWNHGASTEED